MRDLYCIGAAGTLLREQELKIPDMINLPGIVAFFDEHAERGHMPVVRSVNVREDDYDSPMTATNYIKLVQDLRCWVKNFY